LAFSYWIDYLGFITEGKLAAVLIIPSLGVPNWSVIYIINTAPSYNTKLSSTKLSSRWSFLKIAANKITILKHEVIQHAYLNASINRSIALPQLA
jgi:hypothetical protein